MANLLQETLSALGVETIDEVYPRIDWAKVYIDTDKVVKRCILPQENTNADVREFLNSLDEEYNVDYVRREIFGTIMLMDGTWLERSDYGWTHHGMPMF